MANLIKKIIGTALEYSGILSLYELLARRRNSITVLMYHRIFDKKTVLDDNVVSASPKNFEKQMRYLSRKCTVLSFGNYLQFARKGKKLPKNSVIITFDDGYRDNYTMAYPILKKFRLGATISLTSGHIGKSELFWWDKVAYIIKHSDAKRVDIAGLGTISLRNKGRAIVHIQRYLKSVPNEVKEELIESMRKESAIELPNPAGLFLSWKEVDEMSKNGISFAAHTLTHPILTQVSLEEAKKEIIDSKNSIEEQIRSPVVIFTYPNGRAADMSSQIDAFLKRNGFDLALSTVYGSNDPRDHRFVLRRIAIEKDDDLRFLRIKLSGLGALLAPLYSVFFE